MEWPTAISAATASTGSIETDLSAVTPVGWQLWAFACPVCSGQHIEGLLRIYALITALVWTITIRGDLPVCSVNVSRRMSTRLGIALGLLMLGAIAGGCAGHVVYPSGPFYGRVVDADTAQPLVGAAVVAVWYWEGPGAGHPAERLHDAREVTTDAEGAFTLPRTTHATTVGLVSAPYIIINYPGFRDHLGHDEFVPPRSTPERHRTIALTRLRTREEQLRDGASLPTLAGGVPYAKIPNLIRLVNQYRRELGLEPVYEPGR